MAAAGAPTAARHRALCLLRVVGLGLCLTHQPRQEPGEQVREPQADSSGPCADVGTEASTTGAPPCRVPFPPLQGHLCTRGSVSGSSSLTRSQEHTLCISVPAENFLKSAPWPGKKTENRADVSGVRNIPELWSDCSGPETHADHILTSGWLLEVNIVFFLAKSLALKVFF